MPYRSKNHLLPKIIKVINRLGQSDGSPPTHIIENLRHDNNQSKNPERNILSRIRTALKNGVKDGILIYNSGKYKVSKRCNNQTCPRSYYRSREYNYSRRGRQSRRRPRRQRSSRTNRRRRRYSDDEKKESSPTYTQKG